MLTKRTSVTGTSLVVMMLLAGCSLRQLAVNKLGDTLAAGGDVFASDDDPELVGEALPFSLKLIESLLAETPKHRGLLLAAARGFTQYSYGWVETRAADLQGDELDAADAQRERARRLYRRAKNYGLRGLEVAHPGFERQIATTPDTAMQLLSKSDLALLYWTTAAWGLEISLSKDKPEVVADLSLIETMIDRALSLDESYEHGAIHNFLITYEPNRPATGNPFERSRRHFDRALALSGGKLASPFVALAEAVSVPTQNKEEFQAMLQRALEVDVDAEPRWRVENLLAQRRARWLMTHEEELFIGETEESSNE